MEWVGVNQLADGRPCAVTPNHRMTQSIVTLSVVKPGSRYIPGVIRMHRYNNTDSTEPLRLQQEVEVTTAFKAFSTTSAGGELRGENISEQLATDRGRVASLTIKDHGSAYTHDPTPAIYHLGSTFTGNKANQVQEAVLMDNSVTEIFLPKIAGVQQHGCQKLSDTASAIGGLGGSNFLSQVIHTSTAPLRVENVGFSVKRIGQTTSHPSQLNTFTVTLMSNTRLVGTDLSAVSLSGLTGSGTADIQALVDGGSGILLRDWYCNTASQQCANMLFNLTEATWTQGTGRLVLPIARDQALEMNSKYVFSFQLTNGPTGQAAPVVRIEATGTATILPQIMDHDTTTLLGVAGAVVGDAAALYIRTPSFITKAIHQLSPFPAAVNTITVTVSSNIVLPPAETVGAGLQRTALIISGLQNLVTTGPCPSTLVPCATPVGGPQANVFSSYTQNMSLPSRFAQGLWNASRQELILYLRRTVQVDENIVFSFTVSNPAFPTDSPALSIRCQGFPEEPNVLIPIIAMDKEIRPHTTGSTFLLQDLDGEERPGETVFVEVQSPSAAGIIARSYVLIDSEIFFVTSVSGTTLGTFRAQRQSAAAPHSAAATGDRRNVDGTAGYFSTSVYTTVSVIGPGLEHGDGAALKVRDNAFLYADIGQSSHYPAAKNTLTITLAATFELNVGAKIVMSGFLGADTKNSSYLLLGGPSASIFSGSPTLMNVGQFMWDNRFKTATLYVSGRIQAGSEYSVSFFINNPVTAQSAQSISIAAEGRDTVLASDMSEPTFTRLSSGCTATDSVISVVDYNVAQLVPGNYVRVGTEIMRVVQVMNTYLSARMNETTNTITVEDVEGAHIQVGTVLKVDSELLQVQQVQGKILIVKRPLADSYATEHTAFKIVYVGRLVVERGLGGTTAQAHLGEPNALTRVTKISRNLVMENSLGLGPGALLRIDCEIMVVMSVDSTGKSLSVCGGYKGTLPMKHGAGAKIAGFYTYPKKMTTASKFPVTSTTALTSALQSGASELQVSSTSGSRIVIGGYLKIDDEILHVTSVPSGVRVGIKRAQKGTLDRKHLPSAVVYVLRADAGPGDGFPLKTNGFAFSFAKIAQSTSFANAQNTITVTLASNAALSNYGAVASHLATKVTLTGLQGTASPSGFISITDPESTGSTTLFDPSASWRQQSGQLVLSLASGQALIPGRLVSFTFVLVNGNTTQASPAIDIAGNGCVSTGFFTELRYPADSHASMLHLTDDPTFAFTPGIYVGIDSEIFKIVSIVGTSNNSVSVLGAQMGTSASAHSRNAQVRMMALIDMGRTLLSNETDIKLLVADGLGLHSAFKPGSLIKVDDELMLIQTLADIYLTVTRGMQGTTAASHVDRSIVTLYIELGSAVRDGTSVLPAPGSRPGSNMPLLTFSHRMTMKSMGQSTSAPDSFNVITITMSVNKHLLQAENSAITIYGLNGTQTGSAGLTTSVLQGGRDVLPTDSQVAVAGPAVVGIMPGSYIQIGSEIMLVTGNPTTLNQTHLVLLNASSCGLVVNGFILIEREIMKVIQLDIFNNNTIWVERGQALTQSAPHKRDITLRRLDITVLTADVTASDHTIVVLSAVRAGITNDTFIQIDYEVLRVFNVTSDSILSVRRGVAGTVATSHLDKSVVKLAASTYINQEGGLSHNEHTIEESLSSVTVKSVFAARIGVGHYLEVNREILRVHAISGNDLTVWRCQLQSCATPIVDNPPRNRHSHPNGYPLIVIRSTQTAHELNATTELIHLTSRQVAGIVDGCFIKINNEVIRVVAVAVSTESINQVLRGQAGTTAQSHPAGSVVTVVHVTMLRNRRAMSSSELTTIVEDVTHSDSRIDFGKIFVGCFIRIDAEVMLVTGVGPAVVVGPLVAGQALTLNTHKLTLVRAQGGTQPFFHLDDSQVEVLPYTQLVQRLEATSTNATVILVSDLPGLAPGAFVQIGLEIILVTAVNGSTLSLYRGQQKTSAAEHASGSVVSIVAATTLNASNVLQVARARVNTDGTTHPDGASVSIVLPLTTEVTTLDTFPPQSSGTTTGWTGPSGAGGVPPPRMPISPGSGGAVTAIFSTVMESWDQVTGKAVLRMQGSTILNPVALTDTKIIVSRAVLANIAANNASYILVGQEVMLVAAVNGNELRVQRGQARSTKTVHQNGATVTHLRVKVIVQDVSSTYEHLNLSSSGSLAFSRGQYIQLNSEILRVRNIGVNSLEVERARAGSTSAGALAGSTVTIPRQTVLMSSCLFNATNLVVEATAAADIVAGVYVQVDDEIMLVTFVPNITSNTLTVVRAQGSTAAASHQQGAYVIVIRRRILNVDQASLPAGVTSLSLVTSTIFAVNAGEFISIDDEIMEVQSVTGSTLVVSRGMAGTLKAQHANGSTVTVLQMTKLVAPGGLMAQYSTSVLNVASCASIGVSKSGQFVKIDNEVMLVLNLTTSTSMNVSRGAAGTSAVVHADGAKVEVVHGATLASVLDASATLVIVSSVVELSGVAVQSYIQIGAEIMGITSMSGNNLTVDRAQADTAAQSHQVDAPVILVQSTFINMSYSISRTDTRIKVLSARASLISAGCHVKINNEIVRVQSIPDDSELIIERGIGNTSAAAHSSPAAVSKVLLAGETYVLSFTVRNRASRQESPAVSITVQGSWYRDDVVDGNSTSYLYSRSCGPANNMMCETNLSQATLDTVLTAATKRTRLIGDANATQPFILVNSIEDTGVSIGGFVQVGQEIMRVDGISLAFPSYHNVTVSRAAHSTLAAAHALNEEVHTCTIRLLDDESASINIDNLISIGHEVMHVLSRLEDTFIVKRGARGTAPVLHPYGSRVSLWTQHIHVGSASAAKLSAGKYVKIDAEVFRVLEASETRLLVTRAQHKTIVSAHNAGSRVEVLYPGFRFGDSLPLKTYDPGFAVKEIGQKSPFRSVLANQPNTISVTLIPNLDLKGTDGAMIFMDAFAAQAPCGQICETAYPAWSSHPCYQDFDMPITDLHASGANGLFGATGFWTIRNGTGQLLVTFLESAVLPRETAAIFSFTIQNPSGSSERSCPPATVTVYAVGKDVLNAIPGVPGGRPKVMEHDTVFVPQAGLTWGDAAPLKMLTCTTQDCLSFTSIGQATFLPSVHNTITATLALRANMRMDGTLSCEEWGVSPRISLTGLTGAQNDNTGSISVTSGQIEPYKTSLYVPFTGQIGSNSFSDTVVPVLDVHGASIQIGQYIRLGDEFMLVKSYDANKDKIEGDLRVDRAQFGTTATTHGMGTPVEVALPVFSASKCTEWRWDGSGCATWEPLSMCMNGRWDRLTGALTVSILEPLYAGTAFRFSFQLVNPSDRHDAPQIDAEISKLQFVSDTGNELRISKHRLINDGATFLAIPGSRHGDAKPLVSYGHQFIVKNIGQSTTYPYALNTITVTLASTVAVGGGQPINIYISGMRLTDTTDATHIDNPARRWITDVPLDEGLLQGGIAPSPSRFQLAQTASLVENYYVGYKITLCCDGNGITHSRTVASYTSDRVLTIDVLGGSFPFTPTVGVTTYKIMTNVNDVFGGYARAWTRETGTLNLRSSGLREAIMYASRFYVFSFELRNVASGNPSPSIGLSIVDAFTCVGGFNIGSVCAGILDAVTCGEGGFCIQVTMGPMSFDGATSALPIATKVYLESNIPASDTATATFNVSSTTNIFVETLLGIDYEVFVVTKVENKTITARRSERGTGARSHVKGSAVKIVVEGAEVGDSAPLFVRCPGFDVRKVSTGTDIPGAVNTLTITMIPNIQLSGLATITISGLLGLSNPDSSLSLGGQSANAFSSATSGGTRAVGVWNNADKTISLYATDGITAGGVYVISFSLTNPITSQPVQQLAVTAYDTGFVLQDVVTVGTLTVVDVKKPKMIMSLNSEISVDVSGAINEIYTGYMLYVTTGNLTEGRLIVSYQPYYYPEADLFRVSVVLQSELTRVPTLLSTYQVKAVAKQDYFPAEAVKGSALAVVGWTPAVQSNISQTCEQLTTACLSAFSTVFDPRPCDCTLQAPLLVAKIGQTSTFPGFVNTITVTFSSRIPLWQSVGESFLTITGLAPTQTVTAGSSTSLIASVTASDVLISVSSASDAAIVEGTYLKVEDEIMLVVDVLSSQLLEVARAQAATVASAHASAVTVTAVLPLTDSASSGSMALLPSSTPAWTGGPGILNLTLRNGGTLNASISALETNITLVSTDSMTLSSGNYLKIENEIVEVTGVWRTTLTVKRARSGTVAAAHVKGATVAPATRPGHNYTFSFPLVNVLASQASKASNLFFSSLIKSPILKDFEYVPPAAGAQPGDSTPLRIIAPSFVVRKLGQSNPYPGASNVITVTLATNVDISSSDGSRLTVHGLYGAATADTQALPISDDPITVSLGLITAWDTSNPRSIFTLSLFASKELNAYVGFNITVTTGSTTETRSISSYSSRQVTLSSDLSVDVTAATTYRVQSIASVALDSTGRWTQSNGTLVINVGSGVLYKDVLYRFSFPLTNPVVERNHSQVRAQVSSAGIGPEPMYPDMVTLPFSGSERNIDEYRTTSLSSAVDATALHRKCTCAVVTKCCVSFSVVNVVSAAGLFPGAAILVGSMQSGEVMTVMEIHNLELWVLRTHSRKAHSAGTDLRLLRAGPRKGLVASQLNLDGGSIGPSDVTLPVHSGAGILSGDYLLLNDELVLVTGVAASTINVSRAQAGTPAVSHADGSSLLHRVGYGTLEKGDASPLKVYAVGFVIAYIGQSTPYPAATSAITITMVSNIDLTNTDSSAVTILGLDGSATTSGTLTVSDKDSSGAATVFGGQGAWDGPNGKMTLTVASGQTLVAGTTYKLSFDLVNPSSARNSSQNVPMIQASGSATLPLQVMQEDIWTIPNVLRARIGDATPLKVDTPAFILRDISQYSVSPGVENTIYVTISSNVDMSAGSSITVAGFNGSTTPDTSTLRLTDIRVTLDTGTLLPASSTTSAALPTTFRDNLFDNQEIAFFYNITDEVRRDMLDPYPAEIRTITGYSSGAATLSSALAKNPTAQATNYTIQSLASSVFGTTGSWTKSGGSLVLTVATGKTMRANVSYAFAFKIRNPSRNQAASNVTLSATGTFTLVAQPAVPVVGSILNISVTHPGKNYVKDPQLIVSSPGCMCADVQGHILGHSDHCLRPSIARGGTLEFHESRRSVAYPNPCQGCHDRCSCAWRSCVCCTCGQRYRDYSHRAGGNSRSNQGRCIADEHLCWGLHCQKHRTEYSISRRCEHNQHDPRHQRVLYKQCNHHDRRS